MLSVYQNLEMKDIEGRGGNRCSTAVLKKEAAKGMVKVREKRRLSALCLK